MGGCRGKLGRLRCRPRWDTHLNSRSLLNWNSSLAATAAGSVKKCRNGQGKTIWLPFSGSHKKRIFRKQNIFFDQLGGCREKLRRPRCRSRWDTHLNSRSLLNWNSSLAATAAGSVKKCRNGQGKTIWLPFSGSHKKRIFRKQNIFFDQLGGCRGKLRRPRCRSRWDTHLNSRSLLNWNSSLAATAAGSVKKCRNGQVKTIWLPFSGSHKKRIFRKQNIFSRKWGLLAKVKVTKV